MAPVGQFDLRAYTQAIAQAMGPEWQPDCPEDDWRTYIRHRHDPHYALFLGQVRNGKLEIHGVFRYGPNGTSDGLHYREKRAEIHVSYARPPEHIARDIQRRLLPLYEEQYQRNKQYVEQATETEARKVQLEQDLKHVMREHDQRHRYAPGKVYVYAQVESGATVSLKFSSLSLDQVKAILTLLE